LPGGQNLGELEDVKYFEKKLYKSLSVPVSRLNPEQQGFSLGKVNEITRDELKFAKFVDRLRNKFAEIFDQALRVQCVMKGICTNDEWNLFKEYIQYDFAKDNNFSELKDAELVRERISLLSELDAYVGTYFSQAWVQRNVLHMNDDQIKVMQEEIEEEKAAGLGLPVAISNQLVQQQMMSDVPQQPTHPEDLAAQEAQTETKSKNEEKSFDRLKRIL